MNMNMPHTGIEVVDGEPRLSCVVTNKFSDWSTQPWTSNELCIRVHKLGESAVVEAQDAKGISERVFA